MRAFSDIHTLQVICNIFDNGDGPIKKAENHVMTINYTVNINENDDVSNERALNMKNTMAAIHACTRKNMTIEFLRLNKL